MRQRTIKQSLLTTTGLLVSAISHAHPSGEHPQGLATGLWHLLTQPDHLLMLFAGVVLVVYLRHRSAPARQPQRMKRE
ncbi:HupE/UreJ family protein [Thiohalophilus thiocyanatoxydans]|uniref:HupE/UreJ protein n=1 Tax=Thiohalophilus thiocyanatoxydans TaxID=381308 RepID=A0A4R8IHH4_9GAMM|nr:HupE/UreJ family protein [Thiohalophilus thiocyanatoxydans]TDY00061.1 HupE/UreJ protein [Thiohalophilus thiocyanatoxydans]